MEDNTVDESRVDACQGALLGTAVGDALGLPYEGMSKRRVRRMIAGRRLRHRFAFGRGMVSDDTDHASLVALALCQAEGSVSGFARILARKLRWWLAALPAGVGFATLRGIVRLWLGFPPARSGVWSAGNGPAMRAPIIGVFAHQRDPRERQALVAASTRITHSDPKAEQGARAIAAAAASAYRHFGDFDAAEIFVDVRSEVDEPELLERLDVVLASLHVPTEEVISRWGQDQGISGYIYDTVPAALHSWARHRGALEPAVSEIIGCGGDTDTTGAIVGGLAGAATGASAIPRDWLAGIVEWPRSVAWMTRMGEALARRQRAPRYFGPGVLARNALFLALVFGHIFRRAFPPY